MRLVAAKNYQDMSKMAADVISGQVREKPNSVLGLATGGTVLGTYEELINDYQRGTTSYKQVHSVNLDEYIGVTSSDPNSYHYYMKENLFSHIDINDNNVHIPNGYVKDYSKECMDFENTIAELGGIDLQLLGIGVNGHIGFNEPGTPFESITHVVELTESTRKANQRFFESLEDVPTRAITMGISTIMKSKRILLLVSGKKKANILHQLIHGNVDEEVPASILKQHPDVTIIADEDARSLLANDKKKVHENDQEEFSSTNLLPARTGY